MRTLTASAFVLESLGGFLSGSNITNSSLLANAMRHIFQTPADCPTDEKIQLGIVRQTIDLSMEHTGHVLRELQNAEVDLINGQDSVVIVADILNKFIMPIVTKESSTAQIRLNTTLCDVLIQHVLYFGYWYRYDHYTNELH